jgi:glyoxylase-like metal-dependent hydrolase (beta-lactamase superfamily II)
MRITPFARFVVILTLACCGSLWGAGAGSWTQPDSRKWPNLYRWSDTCNVYVLKDGDAALLIEAGDGSVFQRLEEIGVKQVEWILFTHHHREQCQGFALLGDDREVMTAAPAAERAFFEQPTSFRRMSAALDDPFTVYGASYVRPPVQPIAINRPLEDGDRFEWRGHSLHCVVTPGASPGSMTYMLQLNGQSLAFSGDMMLDGGRLHTWFDTEWDYGFGQGLDTLIESVERLKGVKADVLLPSQGSTVTDPGKQLTEYRRKLRRFREHYVRGYPVFELQDAQRDPLSRPTVVPEIFRVTPHLYKFNRPGEGSNFGIIVADSGRAIMVDCGLMSVEYLDSALKGMKEHLGLERIDAMVISHMHGDHYLLGEHLRTKYGAQVWALDSIADICEQPERYDYAALLPAYRSGIDRLMIDRRLGDGEVIEWEGLRLQVDWMPGQTEFGCCVWLELDGKRIAFTGDNIFGDPRDPKQDGHEAVVARNSAVLEEGYLYAAQYLKRLRPDLLMGGHSFVMPEPAAFIDRYHAWARDMIGLYKELLPGEDYRYRFDPYWVKAEPYRVTLSAGGPVEANIVVRNFRKEAQVHEIQICAPPGVTADPPLLAGKIEAESRQSFPVRFTATEDAEPGVHIAAFDITLDEQRYGQWFDCILEVGYTGRGSASQGSNARSTAPPDVEARERPSSDRNGQVVELLTRSWSFDTTERALSVLDAQRSEAEFEGISEATDSFTLKLEVDLKPFDGEKQLLAIPGVLQVRLRQHDPHDRNRQNYPAFKMPDGLVPVMEATLTLHSVEHPDWKEMTIGIPLAMLEKPEGQHEVVLHFTGPRWTLYVDGELLDNEFPFGYPRWASQSTWAMNPEFATAASLYVPAMEPVERRAKQPRTAAGIQYWTPPGHNNWVGDVETFYHQGRYHVFYLYDRRHHQSKFGCGAHYFEHLSTTDFRRWIEHEAATPLEEQWECIGTGVPFVFKDQLCLGYGLHTTRVYPEEKTTLPVQWEFLEKHGHTGSFGRADTPGVPAGSTYSISGDGVSDFRKSNIMFHPCENPSVYANPSGQLRLLANYRSKGTWESESVDGGWRCVDPDFPPGGDCTIFFRWGRFDYIIGGFTGLWSKPADAPDSAYEDLVGQGLDFYDGSNVPTITGIPGGRFLMAAWIPIRGWGGPLVIRELVQFPDGRIGSKWMPEIMPETGRFDLLAASLTEPKTFPSERGSFLLSFDVEPAELKQGRLAIVFLPEQAGEGGCELQINLNDRRAQFGPRNLLGFAEKAKSLREGGSPQHVGDYAIENLISTDGPFSVRAIVECNGKLGGSVIDVEIAGQRTMITYRPDLSIAKLHVRTEELELKNLQMAPIEEATQP